MRRPVTLPQKLHTELDSPRALRGLDHAERGGSEKDIGQIEVGSVQQIECFHAELQVRALGNARVLDDRVIDGLVRGTRKNVAAGIAECAEWRERERARVKP